MVPKALVAAAILLLVGATLTGVAYFTRQDTTTTPALTPSTPGLTATEAAAPDDDPFASSAAVPTPPTSGLAAPGGPAAEHAATPPTPAVPREPRRETPAERPPETPADSRGLSVLEAALCKDVDRETRKPVGASDAFRARDGRIWCFLKLSGGANRKVRAVWHLGERSYPGIWLKAGAYGAETWRTWAYKNIDETMAGAGRVEIVDEKGSILHTLPVRIDP